MLLVHILLLERRVVAAASPVVAMVMALAMAAPHRPESYLAALSAHWRLRADGSGAP